MALDMDFGNFQLSSPVSSGSSGPLMKINSNGSSASLPSKIDFTINEFNGRDDIHSLVKKISDLRLVDKAHFDLIIDVRHHKSYSAAHIKNAINIHLPTTLMKRKSYSLQNIFQNASMCSELKERILRMLKSPDIIERRIKVLLYDQDSIDNSIGQSLSQMIHKFDDFKKQVDLYYLNGGFRIAFHTTNIVEYGDNANNCTESLTDFTLPSATPFNQIFVSSIKKNNLYSETIAANNLDESLKCYPYPFKKPYGLEKYADKLPEWLKFTMSSNDVILRHLYHRFNKIERLEQMRLSLVASNRAIQHVPSICSPNGLCPSCDKINYLIPKGIEYGFKNRYNNVWPYEHSRVKLDNSNDDYFNANFIKNYIATQNPLPATFEDFWKIVWLKDVSVIVSLNQQNPLETYLRDEYYKGSDLRVTTSSEQRGKSFKLRKVKLMRKSQSDYRLIYHFSYDKWPDFGKPQDFDSIIDLINSKRELQKKHHLNDFVLVHCSAGCGRTGVFITLDTIFKEILDRRSEFWSDNDPIYHMIQFERTQRISMVQNFDQYILCYEIVLDYIIDYLSKQTQD